MTHPVVWFELTGKDGTSLQAFYQKLFGWKIDAENPTRYGMVEAVKGRGIPGGVGQNDEHTPHSGVTFYVSTDDIDRSLREAKELGATQLLPRTPLPDGPVLAFFRDPAGNAVGLVEEGGA